MKKSQRLWLNVKIHFFWRLQFHFAMLNEFIEKKIPTYEKNN